MSRNSGADIWDITLGYFAEEYGRDSDKYKHMKRAAKKALNRGETICPTLTEEARVRYSYDDEFWTEYGFLSGTDYSDDEVCEIIDDMRYRICSPYDCTGKPFTMWIDWHRNPTGLISYVHRVGLDV